MVAGTKKHGGNQDHFDDDNGEGKHQRAIGIAEAVRQGFSLRNNSE